jgi:hypothetical protein
MLYSVSETIKYSDPREALGIMTDRSAAMLIWLYGHTSLDELCSELPQDAAVLDLGSGASSLGHEVARQRPDINWTNFDARYDDEDVSIEDREQISWMQVTAPPNLTFVGGNVLNLPTHIRTQRYAHIFSYYMFPYLIDYFGKEVAADAMENVLGLLAPEGSLSTGPNRYTDNGWTTKLAGSMSMRDLAVDTINRYTESWEEAELRKNTKVQ